MSSSDRLSVENSPPTHSHAEPRLAVREIREITWRALVTAGASAGEATLAADAVTFAEIHLGHGLESVTATLRIAPLEKAPVTLRAGSVDVIEDTATRGLLMVTPLGLGLVAARPASSPVLLPDQPWDPVLAGFMIRHCGPQTPAFFAFEIQGRRLIHGLKAGSDRSITMLDSVELDDLTKRNPQLIAKLPEQGRGVLLTSDFIGLRGHDAPPTFSADLLSSQWRSAYRDGVHVASHRWEPVYTAAQHYLVGDTDGEISAIAPAVSSTSGEIEDPS